MSRVIVLGLDNKSVGEFDAVCSLGYSLGGNAAVSPGGSATIAVPEEIYTRDWLDFGNLVVVQPDDLPAYIGMIDTPWSASRPVGLTVYDVEYMLALRSPDANVKLTGSVDTIISNIIDLFNAQGDLYFRMGNVGDIDQTYREETLDTRKFYEQLQALATRANTEMVFRPERDASNGRWMIYIDLAKSAGQDTDFLIADGELGNMVVNSATLRGEIWNRMIGISSQSTAASRLTTSVLTTPDSIERYRVRSKITQFRDITLQSTLDANTSAQLAAESYPYLELSVSVVNNNHAFRNFRLGNQVMTHASRLALPRGVQGWKGKTRIFKMAYSEANNTIDMTLNGVYA